MISFVILCMEVYSFKNMTLRKGPQASPDCRGSRAQERLRIPPPINVLFRAISGWGMETIIMKHCVPDFKTHNSKSNYYYYYFDSFH